MNIANTTTVPFRTALSDANMTQHTQARNTSVSSQSLGYSVVTSTMSAKTQSPLLALPAEVRAMIWEFALTSPSGYLLFVQCTERFDVSDIGAGLLSTCKSVFEETRYLPLRLNVLHFHETQDLELPYVEIMTKLMRIETKNGWTLRIEGTPKDIASLFFG